MRVATLRVTAMLPGSHSLKEKRRVVKSLKDRLRARFNVSVAETDHQDLWQRAELGVALVASDGESLQEQVRHVKDFVRSDPGMTVTDVEEDFL